MNGALSRTKGLSRPYWQVICSVHSDTVACKCISGLIVSRGCVRVEKTRKVGSFKANQSMRRRSQGLSMGCGGSLSPPVPWPLEPALCAVTACTVTRGRRGVSVCAMRV